MVLKIIFTLIFVFFGGVTVWQKVKDREITLKLVLSIMAVPIIFPFLLFVYGYFHAPVKYIPVLLNWNFSWAPWLGLIVYFVILATVQYFMVRHFYARMKTKLRQKDVLQVANSDNDLVMALKSGSTVAVTAGIYEEVIFRYIFVIALFPLVKLFPVSLLSYLSLIPTWLTLGVGQLTDPTLFAVFFVANSIFAYMHTYTNDGHEDLKHIYKYRLVSSWFPAWLYVIFLLRFGLVAAILSHLISDLVGITMGLYWYIRRLRAELENGTLLIDMMPE